MKVLVIGAGLMGAQIGCEYAIGGHTVHLVARHVTAARKRAEEGLEAADRLGLITSEPRADVGARVTISTDPNPDCDLVIESLPEDFDLKVAVLRPLATSARNAMIATNTSSLSITELGAAVGAPERTLGTHYWNPPLLMPLVEVIAGARTSNSVVEHVSRTLTELGKRPMLVKRDVPGFVWNRLQLAVMREALWLAENGVASPETIDVIVSEGLARRWRHVGPFGAAALGGSGTWQRVGENLLPVLSEARDLRGLERWLSVDETTLADVRRRRDAALGAELINDRRLNHDGRDA